MHLGVHSIALVTLIIMYDAANGASLNLHGSARPLVLVQGRWICPDRVQPRLLVRLEQQAACGRERAVGGCDED
jgi:hypothetical protein